MVFSSVTFLFCFLPITVIVYYLARGRVRNTWLLLVSLLFYAWGGVRFLPIMLYSIVINYIGGRMISCFDEKGIWKAKKICFALTICCNLISLGYWKYVNFFIDILEHVTGISIDMDKIALPIGISFFTFQGMSYVIDVYRNQAKSQRNILNLGLYIALFPQLIAGPIVR